MVRRMSLLFPFRHVLCQGAVYIICKKKYGGHSLYGKKYVCILKLVLD